MGSIRTWACPRTSALNRGKQGKILPLNVPVLLEITAMFTSGEADVMNLLVT